MLFVIINAIKLLLTDSQNAIIRKTMDGENKKTKDFEALFNKFSNFIKAQINKYSIQKYGLDRDDILQEVKIKLWKVLENEKKIENSTSYIKKIVNSSVIDKLRKVNREKAAINHEKQKKIAEQYNFYTSEKENGENNAAEIVGHAVELLIDSRRKVVKLFLLGMTIGEIATCFTWSKDKTRNLLYRGLSDLKKILKENGIDYENK
ncbi:MAG: RNA polymerase sigma factor [Candidatus Hydrothermarchaeota archaeon]